jgi:putative transposase
MRNPCRYFNSSPEVIRLAVMMYMRYPLSLRQVEDLLFERGIDICHETVRFWWNRFGAMFAAENQASFTVASPTGGSTIKSTAFRGSSAGRNIASGSGHAAAGTAACPDRPQLNLPAIRLDFRRTGSVPVEN